MLITVVHPEPRGSRRVVACQDAAVGEQPTGNLRHIAAAANARQQALKTGRVEFRAFARRRFTVSGIR
jgi:hypothetical protein